MIKVASLDQGNPVFKNLRQQLFKRLTVVTKIALNHKQTWLLNRESYGSEKIKSILFLYPTVINTYNHIYSPRFEFLWIDVTLNKMVAFPEMN